MTGVKVDCQAGVGLVGSALGGGAALAAQYQAALEDSVALHFQDNHVINCMCHSTENLYRQVPCAPMACLCAFIDQDALLLWRLCLLAHHSETDMCW